MKKVPGRTHCVLPTLRLNYVNKPGQSNFPARTCVYLIQAQGKLWSTIGGMIRPGMEITVPNKI